MPGPSGVSTGPSSPPAEGYLSGYLTQQDYQCTTPTVRRDKAWLELKATPSCSKNEEEPGDLRLDFSMSHHSPSQASGPQFIRHHCSCPNPLWKETKKLEVQGGLRGNL